MRTFHVFFLKMLVALSCLRLSAEQKPTTHYEANLAEHEQASRTWKVENSLLISWLGMSSDANINQVEIFDLRGDILATVRVLTLVPDAVDVGINDVSARQGQIIAVGAVFRSRETSPRQLLADTLLIFDFSGKPISVISLEPSREISRLAIDEKLNIWTLTMHSGQKDPAQVPMIVEYSESGVIEKELLTRNLFPMHAEILEQNTKIGTLSSGYQSGTFWFWLPGSTDLVTVQTNEARADVRKTGLPGTDTVPMRLVRRQSGELVAEIHGTTENGSPGIPLYYQWSATTSWTRIDAGSCYGHRLLGVDDMQEVFFRSADKRICKLDTVR